VAIVGHEHHRGGAERGKAGFQPDLAHDPPEVARERRADLWGTVAGGWRGADDRLGRVVGVEAPDLVDLVVVVGVAGPTGPAPVSSSAAGVALVDVAAVGVGRANRMPNRPVAAVATTRVQRVSRDTRSRPWSRWRGVVMGPLSARQGESLV